ncbi:hypothetical protein PNOK_0421500 [Pyrrhoderma noxium]|uniref:Uncharacterized protein n=1 Tax=Pyrrhoderma noxium TaxID=2282107 RepID=A0A286UI51_9AGAM|nr:hypothetical protein PNOK_0421500 [Pyrrhoderma noxium]
MFGRGRFQCGVLVRSYLAFSKEDERFCSIPFSSFLRDDHTSIPHKTIFIYGKGTVVKSILKSSKEVKDDADLFEHGLDRLYGFETP